MPAMPLTELRRILAGDCPRLADETRVTELCAAFYSELARLMGVEK